MDENTRQQLSRIYFAVEYLSSDEITDDGQDSSLVIEMSQTMMSDLLNDGQLKPTATYIRRYCDVMDDPENDSVRIAAEIDAMA